MAFWTIAAGPAAGTAATASAPASGDGGFSLRLRALQATLSGTSTTSRLVIRDGATLAGTIIWQADITTGGSLMMTGLDIRATAGNTLTVEFTAGGGGVSQTVNAQGDAVPAGQPYGG